jgi:hypothetical protein
MKIYISCSNEDRDLAGELAGQLSQAGFDVWNPAEEIEPGDNWARKIGQALDECDLMVALVTRGALGSGALRADIQYALTSRNYERRLIPVLVGFVSFVAGKDVPWILLKMEPVHIPSDSDDFTEVVDRVQMIAQRDFNAARCYGLGESA